MADKQSAQAGASLEVTATPAEQLARDLAQVTDDAEALQLDKTVPGGKYEVNGQLVDANGAPFKDTR